MTSDDMKKELGRERVHASVEWGLLTLCVVSLLAYVYYSRAAETYLELYLKMYQNFRMVFMKYFWMI